MTIAEGVIVLKDLLVAGSAVFGAWAAVTGINKWKRELEGKARHDAARQLLKAGFQVRDAIRNARAPMISAAEFSDAYRTRDLSPGSEDEPHAYAHVYGKRWKPIGEALQALDAARVEAEALFEGDVVALTSAIEQCAVTWSAAAQAFVEDLRGRGEDFKRDPAFGKLIRSRLHATMTADDALSVELRSAVGALEAYLRPMLGRR